MSNQETNVSTGRFAPNVTYAQNVRAPIPEVQSPRINDKMDWGRAVSDVAGMVGKGFEAYQKKKAADADAAIEQRKQQDLNKLALEFNRISEDQRQGRLSPSAADTRMRAVTMDAIASGLSEEDVYNVGKRHGYQIQSLEADRQKMIMTADENAINAQVDNLIALNDSYKSMKKSDVRAIIDQKNFEIDNMSKYQQQMNLLDPASEDYQRLKTYRDQAFQNNATMNMLEFISNQYAKHEGPITPEAYQTITNAGIEFGVSKGMSRDEASLSIDLVMQRIGLKGDVSRYLHGQQFLTEEKENAIKYMMVSERARALNIPGAVTIMAFGGQEAERLFTTEFSNENPAYITDVVNQIYGLVKNPEGKMAAADTLKEKNIPFMMGAVNNVHSSAHSPYMRGAISTTGIELFNKHNKVRPGMSQEELQIVINNTDGTRGAISLRQLEQTAKTLENSADPVEQELGVQLKKDIIDMNANEVAASMLLDNFIHRDSVRSLMEGPLKDQLRVNKNGELFVRTPERAVYDENKTPLELFVDIMYGSKEFNAVRQSDISTALVGSSGQVVDNLGKINTYLSRLDPEVRKQTLMDLGVAEQGANDEPYEFFTTSILGGAVDAVKGLIKPLNTPIAQLKGKVSDKEMAEIDAAIESGNIIEGKQNDEIAKLQALLDQEELKPNVRKAVEGTIDVLKTRTASATTKSSETLANAGGVITPDEMVEDYLRNNYKGVLLAGGRKEWGRISERIDNLIKENKDLFGDTHPDNFKLKAAEIYKDNPSKAFRYIGGIEDSIEQLKKSGKKVKIDEKGNVKYLSSATTRSSETLANAKLSTDDLSIWDDVEAASAADTRAAQGLSEYDTELGAAGEAHYQEWKKSLPEQLQSEQDYDLRGYYQETGGEDAEGHLTDRYKKPNHPTFSKESKYYKKGMWAGEWTEDGDFKIPLITPKAKLRELIDYWRSGAEPTANLIVDNPEAEKKIDKLENRLAMYVKQLNNKNESADTKRLARKEVNKLRQQISNLYKQIYVDTAGE